MSTCPQCQQICSWSYAKDNGECAECDGAPTGVSTCDSSGRVETQGTGTSQCYRCPMWAGDKSICGKGCPTGPSQNYSCQNGQCVGDSQGPFTSLTACQASCKAPPPPSQNYSCQNGQCVADPQGPFTSLTACQASCKTPLPPPPPSQNYSCQNGQCVGDPQGFFASLAACQASCQAPPPPPPSQNYSCQAFGNLRQCVNDPQGVFTSLEDCQACCKPPAPTPTTCPNPSFNTGNFCDPSTYQPPIPPWISPRSGRPFRLGMWHESIPNQVAINEKLFQQYCSFYLAFIQAKQLDRVFFLLSAPNQYVNRAPTSYCDVEHNTWLAQYFFNQIPTNQGIELGVILNVADKYPWNWRLDLAGGRNCGNPGYKNPAGTSTYGLQGTCPDCNVPGYCNPKGGNVLDPTTAGPNCPNNLEQAAYALSLLQAQLTGGRKIQFVGIDMEAAGFDQNGASGQLQQALSCYMPHPMYVGTAGNPGVLPSTHNTSVSYPEHYWFGEMELSCCGSPCQNDYDVQRCGSQTIYRRLCNNPLEMAKFFSQCPAISAIFKTISSQDLQNICPLLSIENATGACGVPGMTCNYAYFGGENTRSLCGVMDAFSWWTWDNFIQFLRLYSKAFGIKNFCIYEWSFVPQQWMAGLPIGDFGVLPAAYNTCSQETGLTACPSTSPNCVQCNTESLTCDQLSSKYNCKPVTQPTQWSGCPGVSPKTVFTSTKSTVCPTPVPPPPFQKFSCTNGTCSADAQGSFSSLVECVKSCITTKYSCTQGQCQLDPKGTYNSTQDCQNDCAEAPSKYACSQGQCQLDSKGIYDSLQDCQNACTVTPPSSTEYSCVQGQCQLDPKGIYGSLQECQNACTTPPPPPPRMYSCKQGKCVVDSQGSMSLQDCQKECVPPGHELEIALAIGGGTLFLLVLLMVLLK